MIEKVVWSAEKWVAELVYELVDLKEPGEVASMVFQMVAKTAVCSVAWKVV